MTENTFDTIVVGGSYAGLSAALALGRAVRKVLIIDSGKPCNAQTPHSHNFITQDGETPARIAEKARAQVLAYPTVRLLADLVTSVKGENNHFEVKTSSGGIFQTKKILFATGVRDIMPEIQGFAECWGISVIHCPYCHGYEYRSQNTGILINGEMALHMGMLISNWTTNLTIYTNGKATFDDEVRKKLEKLNIAINEKEIQMLNHENGYLRTVQFKDASLETVDALYARPAFEQHCPIPATLGCRTTGDGYMEVDENQKTNIPGIYAAGDNTMMFRGISMVVSAGTKAGAMLNMEMIMEAVD